MRKRILFLMMYVFCHVTLFSQIYIWTDQNGVKHISSTPPPDKTLVQDYTEMENSSADKSQRKQDSQVGNPGPKKQPRIIMYSTEWCGVCKHAKDWFKANKVQFTECDVEKSSRHMQEFKRLEGTGYPLIIIGKERMSGFSEGRMRQLLGMD